MKKFGTVLVILLCCVVFLSGCEKIRTSPEHLKEVEEWHQKRITSLKAPEGWLSLVGLHWLKEGENTFGSDPSNDLVFVQKAPAFIGSFFLKDTVVEVSVLNDVPVLINGKEAKRAILAHDQTGNPTRMTFGSLVWYVIKRGDRFGIRVKDTASVTRMEFKGIERFPVDSAWRVRARWIPYDSPKLITIPTIIGVDETDESPGLLEFTLQGKTFRLEPTGKVGDKNWFLVFGDATNGKETYGAGRFLSVPAPDSAGMTIIDFNKAYNPPCVFTPYATCPLPPEQNILPVEVRAGEKMYGEGHH